MSSRALILATVTLLAAGFVAGSAQAQNLEAGKSASQIFAGTCTACHKSPRGLLKTVAPGALPGFLRQHYTTSPDMAGVLSAYLISNGAADGGNQGQPGAKMRHRKRVAKPGDEGAAPADSETSMRQSGGPKAASQSSAPSATTADSAPTR